MITQFSSEKIRYTRVQQFFFDKGENGIQAAENVSSFHDSDTGIDNHAQFWSLRFHSDNFEQQMLHGAEGQLSIMSIK